MPKIWQLFLNFQWGARAISSQWRFRYIVMRFIEGYYQSRTEGCDDWNGMMMMMYLFTTVPHPHGHWQLQELLGNEKVCCGACTSHVIQTALQPKNHVCSKQQHQNKVAANKHERTLHATVRGTPLTWRSHLTGRQIKVGWGEPGQWSLIGEIRHVCQQFFRLLCDRAQVFGVQARVWVSLAVQVAQIWEGFQDDALIVRSPTNRICLKARTELSDPFKIHISIMNRHQSIAWLPSLFRHTQGYPFWPCILIIYCKTGSA